MSPLTTEQRVKSNKVPVERAYPRLLLYVQFQGCWDVIKVLEQREQLDDPVHAHWQTVVPGKHSTEN